MISALATLLLAAALTASAATPGPAPSPGGLDSTFGTGGVQYTNFAEFPFVDPAAAGTVLQDDGKFVVIGRRFGNQTGSLIVRFNADGTLDRTFDAPDHAIPVNFPLNAAAVQSDGKIVVAGGSNTWELARFNADGTLDASFNSGYVLTGIGFDPNAYALAIQPDGKIVAAGKARMGSNFDFAIVRYNADGTRDASFGVDGIVTTSIGSLDDVANAVAIQPDGRIVAGGAASSGFFDFAIARYNANGTLDTTFNAVGYVTTDFGGNSDIARGLRIAPDGRILAAGSASVGGRGEFAFARYNTNGTPDASFNGNGRVTVSFATGPGSFDIASDLAVLPDGRIVGAGYRYVEGVRILAMVRLTASGALDASFAGAGKFTTSYGASATLGALATQPDGKIAAAGYAFSSRELIVLRVDAAGNLDGAFGAGGFASLEVGQAPDAAYAVAIQADGKIVAAGGAWRAGFPVYPGDPLAVARYDAYGTLDPAFGSSGRVTQVPGSTGSSTARALAIQGDGRIVIGGETTLPPVGMGSLGGSVMVIRRFDASGVFEVSGAPPADARTARAVRIQADGKILAAGFTNPRYTAYDPPAVSRFLILRYDGGLALDTGFNGSGSVATAVGAGDAEAYALAVRGDGTIIAAGTAYDKVDKEWAFVTYSASGVATGSVLVDMSGSDDTPHAMVLQPDGAIVVAGAAGNQAALARFTSPGAYDASFAQGGRFTIAGAPFVAIALQPDGKILAVTRDFHVWRFTAAGQPDPTFGVGGRVVLSMGAGSNANAIAVKADGRIVVAGNADSGFGQDFVVARIDPATGLQLVPSAASLDFGVQAASATSASTLTFTNPGPGAITVTSARASGGYAIASNTCGLLANAGSTCQVGVYPAVAAEGAVGGTLLVGYSPGRPEAIAITLIGGDRSLVAHYYRSILRRDPDSGGRAFWESEATRVSGIGAPVNETWFALAQTFYTSPEYQALNRDNAGYVTDLYNTFFNRAPDSGGLAYWKGQLDSGMPREVLLAQFMFSPEFAAFTQAIFGDTAVRAEVNAVTDFYRGILGRLPDNDGFNYWVGRFRTAQCQGQAAIIAEVETISSAFTQSGEHAARGRTNSQYVGDLYNAFLRRGGDLAGVQYWIDQVATGARTREQVRVEFKNSPEFQARVNAIVQQGCLR